MPKIRELTVYTFDELSDKAKETARQWRRDCENSDWRAEFEFAETAAKLLGIGCTESDIRYSFCSQGDGASFVGSYAYRKGCCKLVRQEFPRDTLLHFIADELAAIQRKHGYKITARISQSCFISHEMTMSVEVFAGDAELDYDSETAETVTEAMRDFAKWIYRGLEAEYNYRMSDECCDESMIANEYEFTADGRIA